MSEPVLSAVERDFALESLQGWKLTQDGKAIHKRFAFKNFVESLAFVNKLGAVAEEHNHHPDLTLGWGYAGVLFTTHDSGGLTALDIQLAKAAEKL